MLMAISFLLYQRGNSADLNILAERLKSPLNSQVFNVINGAINWKRYDLSGRTNILDRPSDPFPKWEFY
jgi:hypothetical protein